MKKTRAYWNRLIHRDLAYFFLGLIIAFSISGITLNHRESFSSREYTVKVEPVKLNLPKDKSSITEEYFKNTASTFAPESDFEAYRERGDEGRVYFNNAFMTIDLNTGNGEIEFVKPIPVLKQMAILHQTTNSWWIWFSDIFGIAMLVIAITGMFISKGKYSFKKRGWILTVIGLIFPFIFLFFIN
ncbi:PepSY-associated TM helix domain-containing protein [uncultured Lacinutrix sp.]|uniref:PepSY-associated TM helix domain-containing protein n=1 Tax=uncultured Lacinutrix sp. TaxID=574032 RepID=UPI0026127776|nr:PepSY-associated TM helix domain-containing protein [uncultured Lacinutrix sp.]